LVDEAEVREEASATWAQERAEWEEQESKKRRRRKAEMGSVPKKDGTSAVALLRSSLKTADPFLSSGAGTFRPTIGGIVKKNQEDSSSIRLKVARANRKASLHRFRTYTAVFRE
ncbi:hypothetical protein FRC16_008219, partial [Serendipita sp. 398]